MRGAFCGTASSDSGVCWGSRDPCGADHAWFSVHIGGCPRGGRLLHRGGRSMRALKAVLIGAVTGAMLAWSYPPEAQESETCFFVDLEKLAEESVVATRDALVSQGWYSDPTD